MALKQDFYGEIFKNEEYWPELANEKLLNVYYLAKLKDFYISKKEDLERESKSSNNTIILNFLQIINSIINQIDLVTNEYRQGKNIDINSITKLFLSNQMKNSNIENDTDMIRLQVQREVLKNLRESFTPSDEPLDNDYLYDEPSYKGKSA